jgi:hypothetical protein
LYKWCLLVALVTQLLQALLLMLLLRAVLRGWRRLRARVERIRRRSALNLPEGWL